MKNIFKHILQLGKPSDKPAPINSKLQKLLISIKELRSSETSYNKDVDNRVALKIKTRANCLEVVLKDLHHLKRCVLETNPKQKYLDIPFWFAEAPVDRNYDSYLVVNDNYVTEDEVLEELDTVLTVIIEALEEDYNGKLKGMYETKFTKLYSELEILVSFLN